MGKKYRKFKARQTPAQRENQIRNQPNQRPFLICRYIRLIHDSCPCFAVSFFNAIT
jgi:hypothetical protein